MPRNSREITAADIMSLADYEQVRAAKREENLPRRRLRRLAIGPDASAYFESWDTMWLQIHEMLRIEKGGPAQLADELAAYNPMIPNGNELTCTLMFEIVEPARRDALLGKLADILDHVWLVIGDDRILARPEQDVDRTSRNKTSSVLFVHFPFTSAQKTAFCDPAARPMVAIDHPDYGHAALISDAMRTELARDFA